MLKILAESMKCIKKTKKNFAEKSSVSSHR